MKKEDLIEMIQTQVPDGADIKISVPEYWEGDTDYAEPSLQRFGDLFYYM